MTGDTENIYGLKKHTHTRVYASGEYIIDIYNINIKKNGQTNRNRVSGLLNDAIFKPPHQRYCLQSKLNIFFLKFSPRFF